MSQSSDLSLVARVLSAGLNELREAGLPASSQIPQDPADSPVLDSLVQLTLLLERWAARINLTGHRGAEAIARRLVLDAVALMTVLPPFQSLADLGSGAGFPGLPIAIVARPLSVTLVEARERRHHFQREVIRTLRLESVQAIRGRFDEVEARHCSLVVAQAVGPPHKVLPGMLPWAAPGAILAIPGGSSLPDPGSDPSVVPLESLTYKVPLDGPLRTLWLGRRELESSE